jgi:hypothetical protein
MAVPFATCVPRAIDNIRIFAGQPGRPTRCLPKSQLHTAPNLMHADYFISSVLTALGCCAAACSMLMFCLVLPLLSTGLLLVHDPHPRETGIAIVR